jgi:hypothetical protein
MGYARSAKTKTYNVAAWMVMEPMVYRLVRVVVVMKGNYADFAGMITRFGLETTPDGVAWEDEMLDADLLTEVMYDLVGGNRTIH